MKSPEEAISNNHTSDYVARNSLTQPRQRKFSVQNFRVTDIQPLINTPLINTPLIKPLIIHHTPLIIHHCSYTTHHTTHHAPVIIHHSSIHTTYKLISWQLAVKSKQLAVNDMSAQLPLGLVLPMESVASWMSGTILLRQRALFLKSFYSGMVESLEVVAHNFASHVTSKNQHV